MVISSKLQFKNYFHFLNKQYVLDSQLYSWVKRIGWGIGCMDWKNLAEDRIQWLRVLDMAVSAGFYKLRGFVDYVASTQEGLWSIILTN